MVLWVRIITKASCRKANARIMNELHCQAMILQSFWRWRWRGAIYGSDANLHDFHECTGRSLSRLHHIKHKWQSRRKWGDAINVTWEQRDVWAELMNMNANFSLRFHLICKDRKCWSVSHRPASKDPPSPSCASHRGGTTVWSNCFVTRGLCRGWLISQCGERENIPSPVL